MLPLFNDSVGKQQQLRPPKHQKHPVAFFKFRDCFFGVYTRLKLVVGASDPLLGLGGGAERNPNYF